jgi:hypothetical protein
MKQGHERRRGGAALYATTLRICIRAATTPMHALIAIHHNHAAQSPSLWQPAAALAAATAAVLIGSAPPCGASELAAVQLPPSPALSVPLDTPPASHDQDYVFSAAPQLPAAPPLASPSLVASPLPSDATADLTAAVTREVMAAALSPAGSGDLGQLSTAAEELAGGQAAGGEGQPAPGASAAAVVEGFKVAVSESIQGANLVESSMPAVG